MKPGKDFYYIRNGQNDIIGIADSTGNLVVSYVYDSWGKLISTTGTLGTPTDTIPYLYEDANWKDKLTSYDGAPITYDAIGNPTSIGSSCGMARVIHLKVGEIHVKNIKYCFLDFFYNYYNIFDFNGYCL